MCNNVDMTAVTEPGERVGGRPIPERRDVDRDLFEREILTAGRPVVMRGLVADWPVVKAGRSGDDLRRYLVERDTGAPVGALTAPASAQGRFHYNADLTGFNFRRVQLRLADALTTILQYGSEAQAPSLAVQSVSTRGQLSGFDRENPMPLLDPAIEPRIWVGTRGVVATHHDPSENIACCVAGRRRFTLFPPDQARNLYLGPFELTPAGAQISLADLTDPDLDRFPRLAEALDAAWTTELEPGDALYIPYLWWHHVEATEAVNMLVNYWWDAQPAERGRPQDALTLAMLAIRDLPPTHRAAWRAMFDHYVFDDAAVDAAHVPPHAQGMLGPLDPRTARQIRAALARTLSR